MYKVVLKDEKWWISNSEGEIVHELGSFDDPISPEIIVSEINGELLV